MTDDRPFKICPVCETPVLDQAPHALVLYFETKEGLLEFQEIFKEAKPGVKSYHVRGS